MSEAAQPSDLPIKEMLLRIFVAPERLDSTVRFYESLFGQPCRLRFRYPEKRLELASIGSGNGSVLVIAGAAADLAPFQATQMTLHVRSLADCRERLERMGAVIIEAPKRVPTGQNMRVRHPDGLIVEYVEHDTIVSVNVVADQSAASGTAYSIDRLEGC